MGPSPAPLAPDGVAHSRATPRLPAAPPCPLDATELLSVDAFLRHWAADRPQRMATVGERRMDFTALEAATGRVAWLGRNSVPYFTLVLGAARLGVEAKVVGTIGYWKKPAATACTKTTDGWVHTGHATTWTTTAVSTSIYIHGRVKHMIISGGENVYPAEVENAIYGHPDVADVAVMGVRDDTRGEAVKAVYVPRPGKPMDPAAIISRARERIAGFKVPKSVDLVPELPHNPTGKILRLALRAAYWQRRQRQLN